MRPESNGRRRDGGPRSSAVVVAGLEDHDVVSVDEVHEPMLFVDSPGPRSGQGMAQLFGLSDAPERVTGNVVE
jgi:hypothetical protein